MKVLIIELSNLGDAILTYPALETLTKGFPQAEFHVLASPRTENLFLGDPRFRKVWIWEKKASAFSKLSLLWRLVSLGFGWVVDFRHSLAPFFFIGAHRTPLIRKSPPEGAHRVKQDLDLVSSMGLAPLNGPAPLPYGKAEELQVVQWLEMGKRPVVMAPGSRSHLKRWGAAKFACVADRLVQEERAQILLIGDEEDRSVIGEVRSAMKEPATDLTGRTTLRQLAALLAKSELAITNDSACLHAASARGTPTVAIFGPSDEGKYGPRAKDSVVVRRRLICAPCERALCPYDHECMRWIEPEEVYQAAVRLLKDLTPDA